ASMNARDGSSTRLELARRRAAALARSWPSSADVHLVGAADAPIDLGRSRAGDLARAVSGIKAGTGGSDIPEAIQFANAAETVVISDQPAPPAAAGVRWIQVGHPVDNLAVTTLAARRLATPDGGAVLLAGISNYGATPHDTEVAFTRDGRDIARRRVHIAPRETTTATVAIPPGGGTFSAELPGNDDALAADDRRSLVLRSAVRVRWASASSTFVARALAANPDVTVENASGAADILVCACGTLPEGSTPVLMLPPAASQSTPPAPLTADVNAHPLLDGIDLDN